MLNYEMACVRTMRAEEPATKPVCYAARDVREKRRGAAPAERRRTSVIQVQQACVAEEPYSRRAEPCGKREMAVVRGIRV